MCALAAIAQRIARRSPDSFSVPKKDAFNLDSLTSLASTSVAQPARLLEVCVDTASAAQAACEAGAGRIELCSALDVGGVTPCQALIQSVRRLISCPLVVLIRPRTGDFVYDEGEREQSLEAVRIALGCGADGVVVGGLNAEGSLDLPHLEALRRASLGVELAMHRAFDFIARPEPAIEQLIGLGFDRILTSGGRSGHVMNHVKQLTNWIETAQNRIVVMPGGGVNLSNAASLIEDCKCAQLHGSFRMPSMELGSGGLGEHRAVDCAAVAHVASLLSQTYRSD